MRRRAPTDAGAVRPPRTACNATVFLPNLWFKLGWKILTLEAEASAVLGTHRQRRPRWLRPDASRRSTKLTLRQFGWVLATELRLYRNAFFLGFETGGATGDQAENLQPASTTAGSRVTQPAGDTTSATSSSNPDYQVDQILFRRLFGTVTNAIYFKPSITYWLDLAETPPDRPLGGRASTAWLR